MKDQIMLHKIVFVLLVSTFVLAQTPVIETFDYPPGDLAGNGNAENGWGGPWEVFEGPPENMVIFEGSLDYPAINPTGNLLAGFSPQDVGCRAARPLAETWPDEAGKEYWISFLMEIDNTISLSDSWQGVSFWLDYGEKAYFGKNWGNDFWGIIGDLGSLNYPSSFAYYDGLAWLVAKVVMSGDAENEMAYLWVNPDPAAEPLIEDAAVSGACTLLNDGFNQIVCHLGMTEGITCYYDEIRVGTEFAHVIPAGTGILRQDANPNQFELSQNYPNPFNPTTTIRYLLQEKQPVNLQVFDISGKEISVLVNTVQSAGEHTVEFNGAGLSSGVYLYRLQTNHGVLTCKMLLSR